MTKVLQYRIIVMLRQSVQLQQALIRFHHKQWLRYGVLQSTVSSTSHLQLIRIQLQLVLPRFELELTPNFMQLISISL